MRQFLVRVGLMRGESGGRRSGSVPAAAIMVSDSSGCEGERNG